MWQDPSLSRLVAASPGLLSLADPYTGYTALHWAAKVDSVDTTQIVSVF